MLFRPGLTSAFPPWNIDCLPGQIVSAIAKELDPAIFHERMTNRRHAIQFRCRPRASSSAPSLEVGAALRCKLHSLHENRRRKSRLLGAAVPVPARASPHAVADHMRAVAAGAPEHQVVAFCGPEDRR